MRSVCTTCGIRVSRSGSARLSAACSWAARRSIRRTGLLLRCNGEIGKMNSVIKGKEGEHKEGNGRCTYLDLMAIRWLCI